MKCIAYTRPGGGLSVIHPQEGGRLAKLLVKDGQAHTIDPPQPVDTVFGEWPAEGVDYIEWAETEDQFVARVGLKDLPPDTPDAKVLDQSDLPDRTFRNAWKDYGDSIGIDMAAAREIHKEKLRQLRAPKLAALDIEYQRADENGDAVKKADIAAQKRALRDVTRLPEIDAAQTPEELKAVMPESLKS